MGLSALEFVAFGGAKLTSSGLHGSILTVRSPRLTEVPFPTE